MMVWIQRALKLLLMSIQPTPSSVPQRQIIHKPIAIHRGCWWFLKPIYKPLLFGDYPIAIHCEDPIFWGSVHYSMEHFGYSGPIMDWSQNIHFSHLITSYNLISISHIFPFFLTAAHASRCFAAVQVVEMAVCRIPSMTPGAGRKRNWGEITVKIEYPTANYLSGRNILESFGILTSHVFWHILPKNV